MSVIERIRWQALFSGTRPALLLPGQGGHLVSYARLVQYIDRAAARLSKEQLSAPDIVGLQIDDPLLQIVLTLALEQIGIATLAFSINQNLPTLALAAVITDSSQADSKFRLIKVDRGWLYEASPRFSPPAGHTTAQLRRVLLTSGSTGVPKGVGFTEPMIERRLRSYNHVFGPEFPLHDRILCCMGLGTSVGYLFLLYVLERGGMFCIPDDSIDITFRKAAIYGVTVVVAAPATLSEMVRFLRAEGTVFPEIELVLTAGSALRKSLADEVQRTLCTKIISFYGATETGVIASAQTDVLDLEAGEVGFIVPGMDVRISDLPDDTRTAEAAGRICVRSDVNASHYFSNTNTTLQNDWFYPGDLGVLSADGVLSIKGRENAVVNLGGHKTTIEVIEGQLSRAPSVATAAAFIEQDDLGLDQVTAVVVPTDGFLDDHFWDYCRRSMPRTIWPSRIVKLPNMPLLPSGKIDRVTLGKMAK